MHYKGPSGVPHCFSLGKVGEDDANGEVNRVN
jgi:hypothetical protein